MIISSYWTSKQHSPFERHLLHATRTLQTVGKSGHCCRQEISRGKDELLVSKGHQTAASSLAAAQKPSANTRHSPCMAISPCTNCCRFSFPRLACILATRNLTWQRLFISLQPMPCVLFFFLPAHRAFACNVISIRPYHDQLGHTLKVACLNPVSQASSHFCCNIPECHNMALLLYLICQWQSVCSSPPSPCTPTAMRPTLQAITPPSYYKKA